jgi:hypothetical protein
VGPGRLFNRGEEAVHVDMKYGSMIGHE